MVVEEELARGADGAQAPPAAAAADGDDDDDDDDYVAQGLRVLADEQRDDDLEPPQGQRDEPSSNRFEATPSDRAYAAAEAYAAERRREDLVEAMRARFMNGEDGAWFDYSAVEADARYDDLEQQARDAEEAWFDDDD